MIASLFACLPALPPSPLPYHQATSLPLLYPLPPLLPSFSPPLPYTPLSFLRIPFLLTSSIWLPPPYLLHLPRPYQPLPTSPPSSPLPTSRTSPLHLLHFPASPPPTLFPPLHLLHLLPSPPLPSSSHAESQTRPAEANQDVFTPESCVLMTCLTGSGGCRGVGW